MFWLMLIAILLTVPFFALKLNWRGLPLKRYYHTIPSLGSPLSLFFLLEVLDLPYQGCLVSGANRITMCSAIQSHRESGASHTYENPHWKRQGRQLEGKNMDPCLEKLADHCVNAAGPIRCVEPRVREDEGSVFDNSRRR
jgi:hypothetical protein